jgi:hypothetical protein
VAFESEIEFVNEEVDVVVELEMESVVAALTGPEVVVRTADQTDGVVEQVRQDWIVE